MRASWLRYAAQGNPTHIGLLFRGGVPAAIGTFAGGNASRDDIAVANHANQALIFRDRQNANVDRAIFFAALSMVWFAFEPPAGRNLPRERD